MRIFGNEVFIKRAHPTENVFRSTRPRGHSSRPFRLTLKRSKSLSGRSLDGRPGVPFTIDHTTRFFNAKPGGGVGARNEYSRLPRVEIQNGECKFPVGSSGHYSNQKSRLKCSLFCAHAFEYLVQSWVEVRAKDSKVRRTFLADNRAFFARGENVPFFVLLRGGKEMEGKAVPVVVQLVMRKAQRF